MSEQVKISQLLSPKFQISMENTSRRTCVHCRKICPLSNTQECSTYLRCSRCKSTIYCSRNCQKHDFKQHKSLCKKIHKVQNDIQEGAESLLSFNISDGMIGNLYLFGDFPSRELRFQDISEAYESEVKFYIQYRVVLMDLLLEEATCRSSGRINYFAYDHVILHAENVLMLDKYDYISSFLCPGHCIKPYLLQGLLCSNQFEKCYALVCHYVKEGQKYFPFSMEGAKEYHEAIPNSIEEILEKSKPDMTKPIETYNPESFSYTAMNYLYALKYMLHMTMEKLKIIQTNFLDNEDCISVICEYLGIPKDWIILDKQDWYSRQAFGILQTFDKLQHTNVLLTDFFSTVKDTSYYPEIYHAIESAKSMFKIEKEKCHCCDDYNDVMHWDYRNHSERYECLKPDQKVWKTILKYCDSGYCHYYSFMEQDLLEACEYLNELAGSEEMLCSSYEYCSTIQNYYMTKFIADAMKILTKKFKRLQHLLEEFDGNETETVWEYDGLEYGDFSYGVIGCLTLERKIAQANFYLNFDKPYLKKLLNVIVPKGEKKPLRPTIFDTDKVESFFEARDVPGALAVQKAGDWCDDVTTVVDYLFEKKLATDNNQRLLFGHESIVANYIMFLKLDLDLQHQTKLTKFWNPEVALEKGQTVHDAKTGLKIKYLSKEERRQRFDALDEKLKEKASNMIFKMEFMAFQKRTAFDLFWETGPGESMAAAFYPAVENARDMAFHVFEEQWHSSHNSDNCEELCERFLDTSPEEAVYDFASVPRLEVVDVTENKMLKSCFQRFDYKPFENGLLFGNKSIQMGKRVVYACGSWWADVNSTFTPAVSV